MKLELTWALLALVGITNLHAADATPILTGKGGATLAKAADEQQLAYLLFYREWDASAEKMAKEVQANVQKNQTRATWTSIRVTDPKETATVEEYKVGRAPMPLLIAVHPNGAVTGAFTKQVTPANLSQCLVSPKKAECMQYLQQNQLVLVCLQTSAQETLPKAVKDFQADPHFAKRTGVVLLKPNDPQEAEFLKELEITTKTATVFMSPPGVLVGTFPITATKVDLTTALTTAGKCCDDPNCKHNKK